MQHLTDLHKITGGKGLNVTHYVEHNNNHFNIGELHNAKGVFNWRVSAYVKKNSSGGLPRQLYKLVIPREVKDRAEPMHISTQNFSGSSSSHTVSLKCYGIYLSNEENLTI